MADAEENEGGAAPASKKQKVDADADAETNGESRQERQEEQPPSPLEDPLVMLARIRRERTDRLATASAAASLADQGMTEHHDLAMSIRLVRALLTTNEEIWDRCFNMHRRVGGHVFAGDVPSLEKDAFGTAFFTRMIYRYVHVYPGSSVPSPPTHKTLSVFEVSASYEKLAIDHNVLPDTVPEELAAIIGVPTELSFPGVYQAYFETALMLNDEALSHFLDRFRLHLETVQVGLGQIESWLGGADDSRSYLEKFFDKKLPDPVKKGCVGCCYSHHDCAICLNCGNEFAQHGVGGYTELIGERSMSRHVCPVRLGSACCATYLTNQSVELESIVSSGTHTDKFEICSEAGRTKLEIFRDYLRCNSVM